MTAQPDVASPTTLPEDTCDQGTLPTAPSSPLAARPRVRRLLPPTGEDTDIVLPDFEGIYTLSGTFSGRDGPAVEGTLEITDQHGGTASAALTVRLADHGNAFFALNTTSDAMVANAAPGQAELAKQGEKSWFSLVFTGREEIAGLDPADCSTYTLSLNGALSGDTISGTWTLNTDMPSSDKGTFAATR